MPTYVTRSDGTQKESEETIVTLPKSLDVRRIRVRWGEVSFFDAEGRESVLVQRGRHPGAGFVINFADHVEIKIDE